MQAHIKTVKGPPHSERVSGIENRKPLKTNKVVCPAVSSLTLVVCTYIKRVLILEIFIHIMDDIHYVHTTRVRESGDGQCHNE